MNTLIDFVGWLPGKNENPEFISTGLVVIQLLPMFETRHGGQANNHVYSVTATGKIIRNELKDYFKS